VNKQLKNDVDGSDDYLKLKVFSSKGDRLPTYRVVFGTESNPHTPFLQGDLQAFVPGASQVDEFKQYADKKLKANYGDVSSLWTLAQVLLNCLKIVWIPLNHEKDDAQAIFESLNDKGMPLTASELLCSYLFRPIIEAKENPETLHEQYWLASMRLLESNESFEEYQKPLFDWGDQDDWQTPQGVCSLQGEASSTKLRRRQAAANGHPHRGTSISHNHGPRCAPSSR